MKVPIVSSNNGRCCIRFSYAKKRYSLTLGKFDSPVDRANAAATANTIYLDCISRNLDTTLIKYNPEKKLTQALEKELRERNSKPTLHTFKTFVEHKRRELGYSSWTVYKALLNRIETLDTFPQNLTELNLFLRSLKFAISKKTIKNYSACLSAYGAWLESNRGKHPYTGLKVRVSDRPSSNPFTELEVKLILGVLPRHLP